SVLDDPEEERFRRSGCAGLCFGYPAELIEPSLDELADGFLKDFLFVIGCPSAIARLDTPDDDCSGTPPTLDQFAERTVYVLAFGTLLRDQIEELVVAQLLVHASEGLEHTPACSKTR